MPTFTFRLHLKTNERQYCLRSFPDEFCDLARQIPELGCAVMTGTPWSAGKVQVCWCAGIPYKSTLSWYPKAGYLETNVNVGSALYKFAEQWKAHEPRPGFSAKYSKPVGSAGLARIDLVNE